MQRGDEDAPPSKVAKLAGSEAQPAVHPHAHAHAAHAQHPHMMQPNIAASVPPGSYAMTPMPPQGVPAMSHAQAMHGAPTTAGHMHGDPSVPAPYMSMHGMPGHVGAVDMSMHVPQQGVSVVGQGQPQAADDVPAPQDAVGMYDIHDSHMSAPSQASVPMPPLSTQDATAMQPQSAVDAIPAGVPSAAEQAAAATGPALQEAAHGSGLDVNQLMGAIQDCGSKEEILTRVKEMVDTHMAVGGPGQGALANAVATDGGMHDGAQGTGIHGGLSHDSGGAPDVGLPAAAGTLPEVAEGT